LNYEWIEKDFVVESTDEAILSNPSEMIINKGGAIVFAKYIETIVGTCALIKVDKSTAELAKMAVTKEFQNKGIGKHILDAVIRRAKELRFKKLILYSHSSLAAAIKIYTRYGFREIPKEDFHNKRANIKMELKM
jgi:GNAT superfamily N-acetyltransferase